MTLRAVADSLLSLLFAPPCAVCGRVLDRPLDGAVCAGCWAAITPCTCPFFIRTVSRAQAIGPYEATLREVIHALKYEGRRSIAPRLSALMAAQAQDLLRDADLVVPVPLHRRRQRQRGFNQAEDLARGLGPAMASVLRRVRATAAQIDLPADARRANVHDAFAIDHAKLAAHRPRVIVLVDDVATTGATLEACARALKRGGVGEVRALTVARVATERPQTRRV